MILHSKNFSAKQLAALEELIGRKLADEEDVTLYAFFSHEESPADKEAARSNLIVFLENLPDPTASEEELDAAILEAMRSVRGPGYTEVR